MTKRVFRYFFDFTEGQEKWLNEMAAKGWRLVKCGQLAYEFESCGPGEYQYAVDFVADKTYGKSRDYKAFLESVGYKVFYKNVNVGIFVGKVKWRPWGDGAGQIATYPGNLQKELVIVEKKSDGKPFQLHTNLTDALPVYHKTRLSYFWSFGNMLALMLLLLFYALRLNYLPMAVGGLVCGVLGCLWLAPALRLSKKIKALKEEAQTHEYEAPLRIKTISKIITAVAAPVLIVSLILGLLYAYGQPADSYVARGMVQQSYGSRWYASYHYLDGNRQRRITLHEGAHEFTVEITTNSGELTLSITGSDGTAYYKGSALATTIFTVEADIPKEDTLTIRVDAKEHSGGYDLQWK